MLHQDKICQPKEWGGLGLRKATDMNKARLAKTIWRLLTDQDSLWCKVLRGDMISRSLSKGTLALSKEA